MTFTVLTASAGSGKTYSLTGRIASALAKGAATPGGLRPSQVIATTFTVKAAGELAERLQERLIDEGHPTIANEIDSALIGTVNSVAGHIVQTYAIDAGLSPHIRVLTESESNATFAAALDSTISRVHENHGELLARLGYSGNIGEQATPFATAKTWADAVKKISELARMNRISPQELCHSAERSIEAFIEALDSAGFTAEKDRREQWTRTFLSCLDALRQDVREYHAAERAGEKYTAWASDGTPATRVAATVGNIEGSLITLEPFERTLRNNGVTALTWLDWMKLADVGSLSAGSRGGKKPGKRPQEVFAPLSAELKGVDAMGEWVNGSILGNAAFREDICTLIHLAFDAASEALTAFAEFKAHMGVMDFVDQETLALELITGSERVRKSIHDRYRFLAVDEFQDTSPLQLELFLRLSELVEDVVWVGDRKQSIYGFRGAAPELMSGIVAAIERGKEDIFSGGSVIPLPYSFRTSEPALALTNAFFSSVFTDLDPKDIALKIPCERKKFQAEGSVEIWKGPDPDSLSGRARESALRSSVASGIAELLTSGRMLAGKRVEPEDIAVLSRSRAPLGEIASELNALGVPTTGGARNLLTGREAHILLAALRLLVDWSDSLALTELITLLPEHAAHDTWFEKLGSLETRSERAAEIRSWLDDAALQELGVLRIHAGKLSPGELILSLTDALNLPERVKSWSKVEERLAVLNGFHTLALQYEDECASSGNPISIAGLLTYLGEYGEEFSAQTPTTNAVTLSTIHGAKGLQWPVVIVLVPSKENWTRREAISVLAPPASEFDPLHPLEGRFISFLPEINDSFAPMARALAHSQSVRSAMLASQAEEARIHYVALTRARYQLVLANPSDLQDTIYGKFNPENVERRLHEAKVWPKQLSCEEAKKYDEIAPPIESKAMPPSAAQSKEESEQALNSGAAQSEKEGEQAPNQAAILAPASITVNHVRTLEDAPGVSGPSCNKAHDRNKDSDSPFSIEIATTRFFHPKAEDCGLVWDAEPSPLAAREPQSCANGVGRFAITRALASRIVASSMHSSYEGAVVGEPIKIGSPLVANGSSSVAIGEAVHAYLATAYDTLCDDAQRALATRIYERWLGSQGSASGPLAPETLVTAGQRWLAWRHQQFPNSHLATETPIAWWNEQGQVMEGWVDAVIAISENEAVLVDHKTFINGDLNKARRKVEKEYVGQLGAYRDALQGYGTHVHKAYIHAPLSGLVVPVEFTE